MFKVGDRVKLIDPTSIWCLKEAEDLVVIQVDEDDDLFPYLIYSKSLGSRDWAREDDIAPEKSLEQLMEEYLRG